MKKYRKWGLVASLLTAAASLYYWPVADAREAAIRLLLFVCCWLLGVPLLARLLKALFRRLRQRRQERRYLRSDLSRIDRMSGGEFEEYLAAHFRVQGWQVDLTPASQDYGADLLLSSPDEMWAVQAKRYRGKVGVRAVQELLSGLTYYGADRGLVVTNAYFSAQAQRLAEKAGVELWDRDDLVHFCLTR